jgi:uncharacterized cupredoxin-like copper-binding protein
MKRTLIALAILALAAPAVGQQPGPAQVTVKLSSFAFAPATIHLRAGRPVVLHLATSGSGGHDFSAPEFFAAATIRAQDRGKVQRGKVELDGHEAVTLELTPAAGRFALRCTHTLHKMLGMSGRIVVD